TPGLLGYSFVPENRTYSNVISDQLNQDYTGTMVIYSVSGYVTENSTGLEDVIITFSGGAGSDITDSNGYYSFDLPLGWSGTATPAKDGYSFLPPSRSYSNLSGDLANEDYAASILYFTISGLITEDGSDGEIDSVLVSFTNGIDSVYSNETGFYEQQVPYDWSGIANPSKEGCDFVPVSRSYTTVNSNQPNEDYSGTIQTFSISGIVTDDDTGLGMNDVMVVFSGLSTVFADNTGYYIQTVPYGWAGIASPNASGYSFVPEERNYVNVQNNVIDQDYVGTFDNFPPGWEYVVTPTSHTFSVPLSALPKINGSSLTAGDFVGVFYYNADSTDEQCGGFYEWNGVMNIAVTAFGDDVSSPEKDGFAFGENFFWKIYDWDEAVEYEAIAVYDPALPQHDGTFFIDGLSALTSLNADNLEAVVIAVPEEICFGGDSQLNSIITGGSGFYSYSWTSVPAGFISTDPNPLVIPTETTTYYLEVSTFNHTANESKSVAVVDPPSADAGSNDTICEGSNYLVMNATAANYDSLFWTTNGDGFFIDPNIMNPVYEPGSDDVLSGSVQLLLTAFPLSPCDESATSNMMLYIQQAPYVEAGADDTICEDQNYQASSALALSYSSVNWASGGDGIFDNTGAVNANYTPGMNDISEGIVMLYLTAFPIGPCIDPITDSIQLTIQWTPIAMAGNDTTICEDQALYLDQSQAVNYSSVEWSTDGDGSFNDSSLIHPTYSPGLNDLMTDTITLTIQVNSLTPCVATAFDSLFLTIQEAPMAFAGNDDTICEGDTYLLIEAAVDNYSEIVWNSSGDGVFDDLNSINPTYFPGESDIQNGVVTLTVNALPIGPCAQPAVDYMLLAITHLPVAPVSLLVDRNNICVGDLGTISLSAQGGSGDILNWYIDDCGSSFIGSGEVIVLQVPVVSTTYYARWENACGVSVCNSLTVNIIELPTVDAGPDQMVQLGDSITLQGSASGNGFDLISFSWLPGAGLSD
ncbi:MAG: hypothetical protein KAG99_08040, partial [Bacteroidales bacterium]|nr:hypothetical protein [Bacteroidales bacterium]